jgi:hypothetical protein
VVWYLKLFFRHFNLLLQENILTVLHIRPLLIPIIRYSLFIMWFDDMHQELLKASFIICNWIKLIVTYRSWTAKKAEIWR